MCFHSVTKYNHCHYRHFRAKKKKMKKILLVPTYLNTPGADVAFYHSCCSPSGGWLFETPWTIYSPPGCSVHGISQPRILDWVAFSFSRESSQPRTGVSCLAGRLLTTESPGKAPFIVTHIYILLYISPFIIQYNILFH